MRPINEIILHCTATRPDWWANRPTEDKVGEIRRWHVEGNGWSDIGYHYLIDRDGTVAEGRPMSRDGAHVLGRNRGTIGISLFGGHGSSENDQFSDNFTPEQDAALRGLIAQLQAKFGAVPVTGHNQYAAKACPGFNAPKWFARKPSKPKTALTSTTIGAATGTIITTGTGAVTAIGNLEGTNQTIVIVAACASVLLLIYIMRERIKKLARGI